MSLKNLVAAITIVIVVAGCTSLAEHYEEMYGPSSPKNRVLTKQELKQNTFISYANDVKPILAQRCVVCHSCYDAPCQLKISTIEGIDRGSSTVPVYNGARFFAQQPSRLRIDAKNTAEWRTKGFAPVLNERRPNEQINLDNSLLYQMLVLKRRNPLPTEGRLPKKYDVGTELRIEEESLHTNQCPTIETFPEFAKQHPEWGMPFAFPGLKHKEFKIIETWLEQGANVEPRAKLSKALQKQVNTWETFLNGDSNKQQLMSRYIYEHLFLGHIYFQDVDNTEFFTLVRSKTPPGEAINIVPTVRPYDDPGVKRVYYRIQNYQADIVDKTHLPYALSKKRLARYKELFLDAEYDVDVLPSYDTVTSANPFKTYAAMPSKNRYQFLLDEAQFFVGGFIKGPVCSGSIALSVIDDHFWVTFLDPNKSFLSADSEFLAKISDKLRLPSEQEDDVSLISVWKTYKDIATGFIIEKSKYLHQKYPNKQRITLDRIWDGGGVNENAALTVYRHYDSATVLKGFVGEIPKTGWVMDYPLLERVHYLLVAGFNVYGKVGHQLSTRLYMDFLRFESELQFLTFLPPEKRYDILDHWYRDTKVAESLRKFSEELNLGTLEPGITYQTDDVKTEFFGKLNNHLAGAQKRRDYINLCSKLPEACKRLRLDERATPVQRALRQLSDIGGEITDVFPNVAYLRVKVDGSVKNDLVYTIVRNKSYLNVNSLVVSKDVHVKEEDTIDIVEGFVGAYPNFFFEIDQDKVGDFVAQYKQIDSYAKYHALVDIYGIRRTNPRFWEVSDWLYEKHKHDNPKWAGLFDLSRYKNR